jgi:hypothetical protein
VHPSGALYQWIDATLPAVDVPACVAEWVNSRGGATQHAAPMPPAAGQVARVGRGLAARSVANLTAGPDYSDNEADRLFDALSMIDAATDYLTWIGYGAALHDLNWIINGVDEGFEIWNQWSETSQGKDGRHLYPGRDELERKWASFGKDYQGDRKTIRSIYADAKALGWSYEARQENINGHDSLGTFASQFTQGTPSNPLIELNEKYCTIGDMGGKCLVMSWVPSKADPLVRVPSFQTFKAFHERHSNRYVLVEEKMRQIGTVWTCWPHRRSFDGIDLVPGEAATLPGNVLNLWHGFAIKPEPGDWHLMREHIAHVLAGGDRASAEYIIRFAAWAVQHPGDRAEVALVFRGGKGSGKGTFANAMRQIFGAHGLQIYSSKHLIGSFNGHLRACLLLFADEAFWAGDRAGESVLKGMLTERTLMIEQKGIDAVAWKNRLHVIMAANADWAVPASHDERRYAVFDVAGHRIGDQGYFDELNGEIARGGLAAMVHDLLRFDLGDWHPRKVIHTAGLQRQKEMSLGAIAGWWENILQNGVVPASFEQGNVARAGDLLEDLVTFSGHAREANGTALGRFLKAATCHRIHDRTGNYWQFPSLIAAREAWERKMGKWPWQTKLDYWRKSGPKGS